MAFEVVKIKRHMADYKKILNIYRKSFPKEEQFPVWLLRILSYRKNTNFVAFYDNKKLCGFSYFFVNKESVFILYLAVNPEVRSKGYGSWILSWIKENYENRVIFLNVEKIDEKAINNVQRISRVEFYKKNGIFQTNIFFTYGKVTYEILSTNHSFSKKEYKKNLVSYFYVLNIFRLIIQQSSETDII